MNIVDLLTKKEVDQIDWPPILNEQQVMPLEVPNEGDSWVSPGIDREETHDFLVRSERQGKEGWFWYGLKILKVRIEYQDKHWLEFLKEEKIEQSKFSRTSGLTKKVMVLAGFLVPKEEVTRYHIIKMASLGNNMQLLHSLLDRVDTSNFWGDKASKNKNDSIDSLEKGLNSWLGRVDKKISNYESLSPKEKVRLKEILKRGRSEIDARLEECEISDVRSGRNKPKVTAKDLEPEDEDGSES